jgi:hypothetical protein
MPFCEAAVCAIFILLFLSEVNRGFTFSLALMVVADNHLMLLDDKVLQGFQMTPR